MSQRVDFSSNVTIYDRRHGAILPSDLVRSLASAGALAEGDLVVDIGAGTGRAALALRDFGCHVLAVDPAIPMLQELRAKATGRPIWIVSGDGERLPCAPGRFDVVILARVLYLIPDWQLVCRQAYAALKPGAHLLHEWGNGNHDEPWVQIREKARALFQHAGVDHPFHPGAGAEMDIDAYLTRLSFVRTAEVPVGPGPRLTLRDFIDRIMTGELSYTWNVPKEVQKECLPVLQAWSEQTYDLDQTFSMPAELHWTVYRKEPG